MEQLVIYDISYPKKRIGKPYDGGYVISELPGGYDAMICGGSSKDSFEKSFLDQHSISCFTFNGNDESLLSVHAHMEPYSNLFMKIDIEGKEFRLFPTFSEDQMKKIKQLVVEIHTPGDIQLYPDYFKGLSDITHEHMFEMFRMINCTHTLVHLHPNNGCKTHWIDSIMFPNVFECTFIRNDLIVKKQPNTNFIPQSIDMPNIPSLPIVLFDHYPFVSPESK